MLHILPHPPFYWTDRKVFSANPCIIIICTFTDSNICTAVSFIPVQNGDGTIDFREYVIGVTILCRPANTEDVLRMAFQVLGFLSRHCFCLGLMNIHCCTLNTNIYTNDRHCFTTKMFLQIYTKIRFHDSPCSNWPDEWRMYTICKVHEIFTFLDYY